MPLAHNGLPSQVAGGQASGTLKLASALEANCALQLEDRRRGPQTGAARGSHLHPVEDTGVPFTRGLGWQQGTGPQADGIPSGCWKENPSHSRPQLSRRMAAPLPLPAEDESLQSLPPPSAFAVRVTPGSRISRTAWVGDGPSGGWVVI